MTREEAVIILDGFKNNPLFNSTHARAFDMAISALSTEGEYIKKSELLQHVTTEELSDYKDCDVIHAEEIDELTTYSFPNSAENKGEWIKIQSGDKDFPESIVCSKCKDENSHLDFNEHGEPIGKVFVTSKFCPNCGADMRGDKAE
jgi:hypothetical protein